MQNKKRLIDANKAQAVLVNMAEHLLYAGNPEMAGAVGYAAEVIGKQKTVDAVEVAEYDAIIAKLESLLCHATGGKYSKAGYSLEDMERMVTDYIEECCEEAVAEEVVQGWISVNNRLPDPFVSVLVQMPGEDPFPTVREGFISNDGIWQSAMFRREPGEVTHWQPMPQPPKGE